MAGPDFGAADPYQEAVRQGYGQSLTDLLRPNPGYIPDLYRNLYAGAQIENQPSPGGYVVPRSPLGQLAEWAGLGRFLPEQKIEPLTDFMKYVVQSSGEDKATRELQMKGAMIDLQKGELDLSQDYMAGSGQLPPPEFTSELPQSTMAGFIKGLSERKDDKDYQARMRKLQEDLKKAELAYNTDIKGRMDEDTKERKRLAILAQFWNDPDVSFWNEEARKLELDALKETNEVKKINLLTTAKMYRQQAAKAVKTKGGDAAAQLAVAGQPFNVFGDVRAGGGSTPLGEDTRLIGPKSPNAPAMIDKVLDEGGYNYTPGLVPTPTPAGPRATGLGMMR